MSAKTKVRGLVYGAKFPCMAKITAEPIGKLPTYEEGFVLSELVKVSENIKFNEAEFYSDNGLSEYISEFSSGEITCDTRGIPQEHLVSIYGVTKDESGDIHYGANDQPTNHGFGFVVSMKDLKVYHQGFFYPKVSAVPVSKTWETSGSGIKFTGDNMKMKCMKVGSADYKIESPLFDNEAAAITWVKGKLNIVDPVTPEPEVVGI